MRRRAKRNLEYRDDARNEVYEYTHSRRLSGIWNWWSDTSCQVNFRPSTKSFVVRQIVAWQPNFDERRRIESPANEADLDQFEPS